MTDSKKYTGVFNAALNIVPLLKNTESEYLITPKDTALTATAKIFDSFLYGLSKEQYAVLVQSSERSPQRLKEFSALNAWATEAAAILDEPLNPSDLGEYADQFSDYPDPSKAADDEMVLSVSIALMQMDTTKPYPTVVNELLAGLVEFALPDADTALASLFAPQEAPRKARRSRPARPLAVSDGKIVDNSPAVNVEANDKLEALLADANMTAEDTAKLNNDFEVGESIDVSLTSDPELEAESVPTVSAADEKTNKAEKAKAQKLADDKAAKAQKLADDKAAKAKKTADDKAAKAQKAADDKAAKVKKTADDKADNKLKAEQEKKAAADALASSGVRRLARTGGGGTGVMGIMRRMVIINPDVPFVDVEQVVTSKDIACKKSTWSPKLSDMRNMLSYLIDMGVVDEDKLNAVTTMAQIAELDEDLSKEEAAKLDKVIATAKG
jgi:hypothetical protein